MFPNMPEVHARFRAARSLTLVLLAGSMLLASASHTAAQAPKDPPAHEPFDLSYMNPKGTHALVGFRPAALLAQPGMEALAKSLRVQAAAFLNGQDHKIPDGVTLADIDQVVADMQLQVSASGEKGKRSIQAGSGHLMVRMKKDVDWPAILQSLFGDVEMKTQDAHVVYLVKSPMGGPFPLPLYAVDARTLVLVQKDGERFVIPTPKAKDMGPSWKHVERCAVAQAFDNRDGYWTRTLGPEVKEFTGMAEVLKSADTICLGVNFEGGINGHVFVDAKNEPSAEACVGGIALLGKFTTGKMEEKQKTADPVAMRLTAELLKSAAVTREGTRVSVKGNCSVKLAELLEAMK